MSHRLMHDNFTQKLRDRARKDYKDKSKSARVHHYCPMCSYSTLDETEFKTHYKQKHAAVTGKTKHQ